MDDRERELLAQWRPEHLQMEQHADVVTLISEAKDDIEKHVDLKLDALKAWGVAAFIGGQALAGLIGAIVTRTTPAEAGRVALDLLQSLY